VGCCWLHSLRSHALFDVDVGRYAVIEQKPIGCVEAVRPQAEDEFCGGAQIASPWSMSLRRMRWANRVLGYRGSLTVAAAKIAVGARHPRNNPEWRPSEYLLSAESIPQTRLGRKICRLVRVDGTRLFVAELDATDKTPVLDIKPVMAEFLPREPVRQPAWSRE
jgi:hypothetical protein